jgi:phage-related tail fiber protein
MSASLDWFLEQARLGNMYHACSAGAVTLSTVSTTCTGLALSNSYGSGKLLVVKRVSFAPSTAPAGASVVGIAIHTALSPTETTHTTPMVIHNAIAKGNVSGNPTGRADASATLASTPLWLRPMAATIATSTDPTHYNEDVNGDIIIAPGGCLSLSYLTTAAVGIAAITWVEIKE